MATMYFDDGSSIDTATAAATQSPPGYLLSDYSANFMPSNASPGATNWAQVLQYGFGRLVDYKTASLQAQNTPPQYSAQATPPTPDFAAGGVSGSTLLILGAVALAAVLLLSDK